MAIETTTAHQNRRDSLRSRRTAALRPLAWIRDHPGGQTLPSQQALDAISNTADFPRH
jgi:hypothetical protein